MNILIVEDENIIAKHLQFTLQSFGYKDNEIATDFQSALELLQTKVYDLAIIDINLNGFQTGIEIGEYINAHLKMPFIYLTSHEEMAIVNAALQTAPYAFLNKPFQKIAVYTTLKLALSDAKKEVVKGADVPVIKDALFIKERHTFYKILLADLLYIRSDDNYLELHTTKRRYTIRETLKNIIGQLPEDIFFRAHKSFIINLNEISSNLSTINYTHVIIDDVEIPITTDNRLELLSRIKTFS